MNLAIYGMVYLGSALMVYNIYGFMRFAREIQGRENWGSERRVLYFPIALLVLFLLGYLAVGIFGSPDLIVSGILFGGSIFVFVMYRMLDGVTKKIRENEHRAAELMASAQSNETKAAFLASVSHEMRTPLNVIIGLDRIALEDESVSAKTHASLEKIELSAQHLLGLVNNMLDMHRIDSGVNAVLHEEFSLRNALAQTDAITQALCDEKGLSFEHRTDQGIADVLIGDEMQVKQVILRIINNAVKYTDPPGTIRCSARVVSQDEGTQTISLSVSDTGIGIDEEFLPHVFDAFSREDLSSTSRHGGGGLSLAVSKRIVESMGGSIRVESTKGEGTTFTVEIPFGVAPQREAVEEARDEADAGEPVSLEGCRVLVVDDVAENAEIVADLLDLEGCDSEHAENGKMAVDMFSRSPERYYDAIIMDLRMPIMDGLEATRQIRQLGHPDALRTPIIALSANAYASDINAAMESGMNDHLAKPIDADLLYATLARFIAKSEGEEQGQRDETA